MSFLERLAASVTGFRGYRRLAAARGGGYGYLALVIIGLTVLAAGITVARARVQLRLAAAAVAGMPDFGLRQGRAYYNGPQPAVYREGGAVIIIDTTGRTTEAALRGEREAMLVTRDYLVQKRPFRGTQRIEFRDFAGFEFTRGDLERIIPMLLWFVIVGQLFVLLWWLGVGALLGALLGAVGLLAARSSGRPGDYGLAFKLACHALTLPMALIILPVDFRHEWLVQLGLGLAYTVGGVLALEPVQPAA